MLTRYIQNLRHNAQQKVDNTFKRLRRSHNNQPNWKQHRGFFCTFGKHKRTSTEEKTFSSKQESFRKVIEMGSSVASEGAKSSTKSAAVAMEATKVDLSSHIYATDDLCDYRGMQLCFLGTSSSIPTMRRNTSCLALRMDKGTYLFDCGEGAQKQLYKIHFRFGSIGSIFITHMHGDHVFGLPGLLSGLGLAGSRSEPINIYGPDGLRMYLRNILKGCSVQVSSKYAVHELKIGKKPKNVRKHQKDCDRHEDELMGEDFYESSDGLWELSEDNEYIVKAGLLRHSIPCWGYIVEEKPRPGRFNVERAQELGIRPGRNFAFLQQGRAITLQNGQKIMPSDVLGHPRRGRKIVILGDTYDSTLLLTAAKGADVLVHECTILEDEASQAVRRFHSTATMAGRFARDIETRCLVLTHFSCKFEGKPNLIQESVKAAQIAFGSKKVIAAKDFLCVTVMQTDEPT